MPYGYVQVDLASFPYIIPCKTCDPWDGAKFDQRAMIWTLLVEAHLIKLHAKFSKPMPYGYVQVDLASFPYIIPCKTCDPWDGAKFDQRAMIWTLLVEAHLIKLQA